MSLSYFLYYQNNFLPSRWLNKIFSSFIQMSSPKDIEPNHDEEYQYLHPLTNSWVLWYQPVNDFDSLQKVVEITTVEEFWSVFNNLRQLENMDDKTSLYFFKEGIRPAWEEKKNKGRLKGSLIKGRDCKGVYQQILMHCVGESYKDMDDINGVAICVRKNRSCRVDVWLCGDGAAKNIEKQLDVTLIDMDIEHSFKWDDFSKQ
eukprot:NODE_158_length_16653_cov_0.456929.p8 type:complete len:203 gc:universal NODE_158_length_16653_cov_0.456929:10706-10098(-)